MSLLNELTTIVLPGGTTITTDNPDVEDKIGTAILGATAVAAVAVGVVVYKKFFDSQEEKLGDAEKNSN